MSGQSGVYPGVHASWPVSRSNLLPYHSFVALLGISHSLIPSLSAWSTEKATPNEIEIIYSFCHRVLSPEICIFLLRDNRQQGEGEVKKMRSEMASGREDTRFRQEEGGGLCRRWTSPRAGATGCLLKL